MSFEVDEKNLDTAIERMKISNVLPINKKHIIGFVKDFAADDRSKKRLYKYITVLVKIDSFQNFQIFY